MNTTPANPAPAPIPSAPNPPVYGLAPPAYYGPGPAYYGESPADAGPLNALDPLQLLLIARKKWLTILLTMLFVVGAAIFYLSKATRIYMAQATIELSVRRPRILNKQEAMIEDPAAIMQIEDTLNTQIEKFKGKSMLPHVVASYRLLFPEDRIPDGELATCSTAGPISRSCAGRGSCACLSKARIPSSPSGPATPMRRERRPAPGRKTGRRPTAPWPGWKRRRRRRSRNSKRPTRPCSTPGRNTRWTCWKASARRCKDPCFPSTKRHAVESKRRSNRSCWMRWGGGVGPEKAGDLRRTFRARPTSAWPSSAGGPP